MRETDRSFRFLPRHGRGRADTKLAPAPLRRGPSKLSDLFLCRSKIAD
jgi:hypothetical protein